MATFVLQTIASFGIPLLLAYGITPYIINLSHTLNAVDKPNERKVHKEPTPRLGGMALYTSFIAALFIFYLCFPALFTDLQQNLTQIILLGIALTSIFMLGAWDDISPLSPKKKFAIQFIVAAVVYFAGFRISTVMSPIAPEVLNVELLDFPLTILWIIGITNAINLIDGLDGLASGIATIACVTIFTISFLYQEIWSGLIALMLAGCLVGFIRYNFNPAKIFLGDSGSLLLGFSLAILSMHSSTKITTGFSIFFPIVVLGLPVTDTILSMLRRFLRYYLPSNHQSAEKSFTAKLYSMFVADKSHIHHQLLDQGFSHRNTVILLYIISAIFAVGAISLTWINSYSETIILLTVAILGLYWGIRKLKYHEIDVLRNGIFLPLYERILINKVVFQNLLDLGFITLSFSASFYIADLMNPNVIHAPEFQTALVITCIIQLTVFWITGLYKENIRLIGLGDVLKVFKSVAWAVLILGLLIPLLVETVSLALFIALILDLYFLLTLVLGVRFSYHIFKYLFEKSGDAESYILIHGVNESGLMLLKQILNNHNDKFKPIGFLDENPDLEGKYVNGYPVFGGHWKLPRLLQTQNFDHILIEGKQQMKPTIYERIKSFSNKNNIELIQYQFNIQNLSMESAE